MELHNHDEFEDDDYDDESERSYLPVWICQMGFMGRMVVVTVSCIILVSLVLYLILESAVKEDQYLA